MIIFLDPLFIRSKNKIFYLTHRIWDWQSTVSVYEYKPNKWANCDHGHKPWTFVTDTINLRTTDPYPQFRVKHMVRLGD